jgi:hypothetical protein
MAAPVLSSHRARLITAALLAAPRANPWTRAPLFPNCTRTYLVVPCRAGELNRPGKSTNSSFGKQRPLSGSSSSKSSAAKGNRQQQGSEQPYSSRSERTGRDYSPNSSRSNSRRDSSSSTDGSVNQQASRPGVGRGSEQHSPIEQNPTRPRSTYNSTSSSNSRAVPPPISSPLPQHAPLLVVGAGAAGLTAAYFAAKQGAQVGTHTQAT